MAIWKGIFLTSSNWPGSAFPGLFSSFGTCLRTKSITTETSDAGEIVCNLVFALADVAIGCLVSLSHMSSHTHIDSENSDKPTYNNRKTRFMMISDRKSSLKQVWN